MKITTEERKESLDFLFSAIPKTIFSEIGIPIKKIKQPYGHLTFITGISIPEKLVFILKQM